jgi:hypothetical protein
LSSSERVTDELLDRLILNIKSLMLLQGSEAELRAKLIVKLANSHDPSLRKFVDALQSGRLRHSVFPEVLIAVGELVFASLLVVAGTVVLVPTASHTPLVTFIEFVVGALLMLSAFYTLRQAALNLKEAGLTVISGEP